MCVCAKKSKVEDKIRKRRSKMAKFYAPSHIFVVQIVKCIGKMMNCIKIMTVGDEWCVSILSFGDCLLVQFRALSCISCVKH